MLVKGLSRFPVKEEATGSNPVHTAMADYNKQYYEDHKEERKAAVIKRQRVIRDCIQSFKLESGCSVCGYSRSARALQFHHPDGVVKEGNIGSWTSQGHSVEKIMKEAAQCLVLCANCHAELHDGLLAVVEEQVNSGAFQASAI